DLICLLSSRRRHTRFSRDWSSDVCSSDLHGERHSKSAQLGLQTLRLPELLPGSNFCSGCGAPRDAPVRRAERDEMQTTTLGYPRIGRERELKRALEAYWSGRADEAALLDRTAALRRENLLTQREAGIDLVPVNDFSLYDHVLDTSVMLGAVPARFDAHRDLAAYFLMARGRAPGAER